jgi:cell division protease FtsH
LIDYIGMCLGGRIAEENIYGEDKITTGAQNDLEKSTKVARRMVTEFGMSERLGPMTFGKRNEHVFLGRDFGHERDYGERVAEIIDEEVKLIITAQYNRVKELLLKYQDHMHAIVKVLLEKETLDANEFAAIVRKVNQEKGWPTEEEEPPADTTPTPPTSTDSGSTVIDLGDGNPEPPPPELRPKFA